MNERKRIAVIFAGGTIATYRKKNEKGVFSLETTEELSLFIPDLEDRYRFSLFSNRCENKFFMTLKDWESLYALVKSKYSTFDGFVIAQESDSLLFGAGLFSYMFSKCRKSIVFLSSPFPLGSHYVPGSNPEKHLSNAIDFAASDIGEVSIYDNNILHRAVRGVRNNVNDSSLFCSYQSDPIAEIVNGKMKLYLHRVSKQSNSGVFPYTFPSHPLLFIRIFPGCELSFLAGLLEKKELKAVVIETLGYGSLSPQQLSVVERLSESGVWVVLLAKNDSNDRIFPMSSDDQKMKEVVLLKNVSVWGAYAKAQVAIQNTQTLSEFQGFMYTSFNSDLVE